jgi:predicted DNA-binding protein YlxM (UPF0122 family)
MFVKDLSIVFLLDFYGDVLQDRTRSLLDQYFNEDLSLAEIAEREGVSRQGIRQALKKGEAELRFLEEKLGLAAKFLREKKLAERLLTLAEEAKRSENQSISALGETARECALEILSEE